MPESADRQTILHQYNLADLAPESCRNWNDYQRAAYRIAQEETVRACSNGTAATLKEGLLRRAQLAGEFARGGALSPQCVQAVETLVGERMTAAITEKALLETSDSPPDNNTLIRAQLNVEYWQVFQSYLRAVGLSLKI
ncbi:MAG: hypothetical protein PHS44_04430 [Candidatus Dojkabacteria bacterium]|nr:hypothetical protein [Candidatus Dojkabacteria bacterium]